MFAPTFLILNGAKPRGMNGSSKIPRKALTWANVVSKMSIRPLRKLAARMNRLPLMSAIVPPLYTAPFAAFGFCELSTLMTAVGPEFQPEIVPSSVTKINRAGVAGASKKSIGLPLNIIPVGDPGADWLGALGTVTIPLPLIGIIAGTGGVARLML